MVAGSQVTVDICIAPILHAQVQIALDAPHQSRRLIAVAAHDLGVYTLCLIRAQCRTIGFDALAGLQFGGKCKIHTKSWLVCRKEIHRWMYVGGSSVP